LKNIKFACKKIIIVIPTFGTSNSFDSKFKEFEPHLFVSQQFPEFSKVSTVEEKIKILTDNFKFIFNGTEDEEKINKYIKVCMPIYEYLIYKNINRIINNLKFDQNI